MTDERRYVDEEVEEIFRTATKLDRSPRTRSSSDGLTLGELQEIGREVGVLPERIADAASALDRRRSALPARTDFGMPITVTRSVDVARPPTNREWDLLVGEFRETFHATGTDVSRGELRGWINGNLHAYVEPTESGYRFRVGTLKEGAVQLNRMAIGGLLLGLIMLVLMLVTGDVAENFVVALMFGAMGAATFGYNALALPRWAAEREEQMEYLTDRASALLGAGPEAGGEERIGVP